MKIAVIIPAAGKSTRYGEKDKLAEDLGGRPLLLRTVEFFTKREEITQIIVVGPVDTFNDFKERFGPALSFHDVLIVEGGTNRSDSVKNGLKMVEDGIDRIAVHDAARPALTNALFESVLLASKELDAVAAATRITGTVKRTKATKQTIGDDNDIADAIFAGAGKSSVDAFEVEQTLDRSGLWELQTPQIFEPTLLQRAYDQTKGVETTDDAHLVEELGEVVHLVQGESRNIKVTTKSDLTLVKAILGVKVTQERTPNKRF
jgi:2-C-methyl-D-erythritol 4-phosphate cytidylyltransferase